IARAAGADAKDGVETPIDVRPWSIDRRVSASGYTSKEEPKREQAIEVPEGTALDEAEVEIELSPSAIAAVRATIPFLMGFPYGCTEQTMSRFLPVLAIERALKDLGLKAPEVERTLPQAIAAGLARVAQLQHPDGGWG